MQTIDVKKVILSRGLEIKEVAKQLFPRNKYPELALSRVLKGKNKLDSDQISKLSLFTGVPISELFSGGKWRAESKSGSHVFTNGGFRAELDTEKWVTKLFHEDSLFHEEVLHTCAIPLGEYFKKLDAIIENFESTNQQK